MTVHLSAVVLPCSWAPFANGHQNPLEKMLSLDTDNSDRVVLDTSICTVGRWRYVLQRELVPRGAAVCQLPL